MVRAVQLNVNNNWLVRVFRSLYDNTVSCVMPGSFDYLTSLHSL